MGAQQPGKARFAAKVAWLSALAVGVVNAFIIFTFRHELGAIFSRDEEVIGMYANVVSVPLTD